MKAKEWLDKNQIGDIKMRFSRYDEVKNTSEQVRPDCMLSEIMEQHARHSAQERFNRAKSILPSYYKDPTIFKALKIASGLKPKR